MLDIAHVAQQTAAYLQHLVAAAPSPSPSPAPKASSGGGDNYAGLAALFASITGLVTAIGAIIIGMRNKREGGGGGSAAADKAIEYLIKQNKELLKGRDPEQRKRP